MASERCETCRFWSYWSHYDEFRSAGSCRRYPPVINNYQDDEHGEKEAHFPVTGMDDWCGEWQPISPPSAAPEPASPASEE